MTLAEAARIWAPWGEAALAFRHQLAVERFCQREATKALVAAGYQADSFVFVRRRRRN
jgi:hypothetical protein